MLLTFYYVIRREASPSTADRPPLPMFVDRADARFWTPVIRGAPPLVRPCAWRPAGVTCSPRNHGPSATEVGMPSWAWSGQRLPRGITPGKAFLPRPEGQREDC